MTKLACFTFMLLIFGPGAAGAADQLRSLGQQTLQMSTGRLVIDLSHRSGRYLLLRLKVLRGKVLLSKVIVTYDDGSQHVENRRINLLNKERTRPINPLKSARTVKTMSLIWTIRRSDPETTVIEVLGVPPDGDEQRAGDGGTADTAGITNDNTAKTRSKAVSGPRVGTCKDVVTVSGKPAWTKVPTAYLNSLYAWQKTVQARHGSGFKIWRGAKGRSVKCFTGLKQGKPGWICTHSGAPCFAKPFYVKKQIKN